MMTSRFTRAARLGSLAAAVALGGGVALTVGGGTWAAAAEALGGVTVRHDVAYLTGPCEGVRRTQHLDAYLPEDAARPTAAVVFVHGGGFRDGDKRQSRIVDVATDLARRGWAVFSINYCMPQESPGFPVEVENTVAAVRYVATHAAANNVDPTRIATWGGSAGANLGLMAAVRLGTDDATSPVAAGVGWSGPYDFLDDSAGPVTRTAHRYLGCDATEPACHDTAAAASPVTHVDRRTPPMFLVNSTREMMPLSQLTSMASALADAQVPYELLKLQGSLHSMAYTHLAYCPSVDFLETYLGPTTGGPCQPPAD